MKNWKNLCFPEKIVGMILPNPLHHGLCHIRFLLTGFCQKDHHLLQGHKAYRMQFLPVEEVSLTPEVF